MHHRSYRVALATVIILTLAAAPPALPCSICRCGDPTFNALGIGGYAGSGLRLAFDWERFDKDEGDPLLESESQIENRWTLLTSYSLADRYRLVVRIPYSMRDLTTNVAGEDPEAIHTEGFSDPELLAQARIGSAPLSEGVGQRYSITLGAGLKTPWGQNNVSQGLRVDEHAQPGTGSTDVSAGVSFLYLESVRSSLFASGGYRHTGRNDYGYRYGSSFLASLAYEYKPINRLDGVLELDYRFAAKDEVDAAGTQDDDTGGSLLYVAPKLVVALPGATVLRVAGQIPVLDDLNGFQKERVVVNVGLTRLLSL